jgi:hypothetical protein
MYLVHQPTGLSLYLAKRMGYGWYFGVGYPDIAGFLSYVEKHDMTGSQDDFIIGMENASLAPAAVEIVSQNEDYSPEHYDRFKFSTKEDRVGTLLKELEDLKATTEAVLDAKDREIEALKAQLFTVSHAMKTP